MIDADVQQLRMEMRKLQDDMSTRVDAIDTRLAANEKGITLALEGAFSEIVNILDNSHPEWSGAAYAAPGVVASDAGDANLEAYNWYRQLRADTVLTRTTAHIVKAVKTVEPADHSLWAANEAVDADIPRYDKINAWLETGHLTNAYDLFAAIPNDIIFPGQIFYIQLEAMLAGADELPDGVQIFAGIFDSTAGQEKYIEGGTFKITDGDGNDPGVSLGVPGSTSVNYKVLAYTDSAEVAESNVLNFPNAPAVFDGLNHPVIKFGGVPGFIKFEIYREIAGTYVLQFVVQNSFDLTYHDIGNDPVRTITAFPTATTTKPRGYAVTRRFVPGHDGGTGWVRHTLTIFVPLTYNRSLTGSGQQFLRIGLTAPTAVARQVRLRRVGFSHGNGKWSRSPNDMRLGAHSSISSTATASGGSGGGGIGPPPGGGGGGDDPTGCPRVDQFVRVMAIDGTKVPMRADELSTSDWMWNPILKKFGKVKSIAIMRGQIIWGCSTADEQVGYSSASHPIIRTPDDRRGRSLGTLDTGDGVMVEVGDELRQSRCDMAWPTGEIGDVVVIELEGEVDAEKIYCYSNDPDKGWIVAHNNKRIPGDGGFIFT